MIFIIGIDSFVGKNLYIKLKNEKKYKLCCLEYNDIDQFFSWCENDIVINCCDIEHNLVDKIIAKFFLKPFLIHLTSLTNNNLCNKNIEFKTLNEKIIEKSYPSDKYCIIRSSNIFGYNCKPFDNNLLVDLMYEKVNNLSKSKNIDLNQVMNFISIDGFCDAFVEIINTRRYGCYNLLSNNNVKIDHLIKYLNTNNLEDINISNNYQNINLIGENIVVYENFVEKINKLEKDMVAYQLLETNIDITNVNKLISEKGEMFEISNLNSERLYKITFSPESIRGNHYHHKQIENFFINYGRIIIILAHKDRPDLFMIFIGNQNTKIIVRPYIIHTFVNDMINEKPEIFVCSTQKFIENSSPDTEYVKII